MSVSGILDQFFYRFGVAMLGMPAGTVISMAVAFPLVTAGAVEGPLSRFLLAGVIAGFAAGALIPGIVLLALQGIAYFLFGLFASFAQGIDIEPPSGTPRWLVSALVFGVLYFTVLSFL